MHSPLMSSNIDSGVSRSLYIWEGGGAPRSLLIDGVGGVNALGWLRVVLMYWIHFFLGFNRMNVGGTSVSSYKMDTPSLLHIKT